MANRIQLRRDTAANWTRVNPILEDGEPGLEINTNKVKYGDGNTRWNALPYASTSDSSNTHIEYTDDTTGYTSTVDLTYDFNVDTDNSHLDINGRGSWSIGSNNFDTKIYSTSGGSGDPTKIIVRANDNDWTFGNTGNLTLPPGGRINYSNGASILDGIVAGGSTYGNANVATYLVANPQAGTYSNANVASYLPTYSGNIAGNIVKNGQIWTFGTNGTLSTPGDVQIGSAGTYGNISFVDTITANTYVVRTGTVIGNLTVGNLVVNGNSSVVNTESYVVEDNIIQMANSNPADTLDLGFVAHRTVDSTLEHTGLIRDAGAGIWRLFSNVTAQPGTTVDFTNANYDVLQVGGLNTVNITATGPVNFTSSPAPSVTPGIVWPSGFQTDIYGNTQVAAYLVANPQGSTYSNTNVAAYLSSSTLKTVANLAVSGSAPSSVTGSAGDTIGMIRVDSNYVYYCTSTFSPNSYTVGWGGSVNNTLFLTKGSYPTPQVGWTVSQGGLDFTINTISDDGFGSWQITWVGTPYGSPTGGTATLTNPSQPAIWKSIPLTTFQTAASGTYSNANVASYLVANPQSGTYSNTNVAAYLTTASITTTGNITAGNLIGNVTGTLTGTLTGNVIGTIPNVDIIAGSYTSRFTNTGTVTMPNVAVSGNVTATGIASFYAPNRPAFRVYGTSGAAILANTTIASAQGATIDYNQGSYYNNSTGIFTAPVPGLYHAYGTVRVANNNGLNQVTIVKNNSVAGANVIAFWETDGNVGTAIHFSLTGYAQLTAGDTLRMRVLTGNVNFDSNDSWGVTYIG